MAMTGTDRQAVERCIDQCLEVVKLASRCSDECLKSDQVASMRDCIGLCLDAVGVASLPATPWTAPITSRLGCQAWRSEILVPTCD